MRATCPKVFISGLYVAIYLVQLDILFRPISRPTKGSDEYVDDDDDDDDDDFWNSYKSDM